MPKQSVEWGTVVLVADRQEGGARERARGAEGIVGETPDGESNHGERTGGSVWGRF